MITPGYRSLVLAAAAAIAVAAPVMARAQTGLPEWAVCSGIANDAERLACFDAFVVETSGLEGRVPVPSYLRQTLIRMLGDPETTEDIALAGQGEHLIEILPGRWLVDTWNHSPLDDLDDAEGFARGCDVVGFSIETDGHFDFSGYRESRDGERLRIFRLAWAGGNTFAWLADLDGYFAWAYGDRGPDRTMGLMELTRVTSKQLILLPITDDLILGVSPNDTSPQLWMRCPSA